MKKSAAVLGVVVVLGIAYTGSSWYVGKKAQGVIEQFVARDNRQFLQLLGPDLAGGGATLTIDEYKRGVFSSDAVYSLRFKDRDGKPVVVRFGDHLDHGPFPAAALRSGHFAPVMAVSYTRLMATPATQEWFDALKDKNGSPITAVTRIGFSGTGHSLWQVRPLQVAKKDGKLDFSGGTVRIDLSNHYRNKNVRGAFDALDISNTDGTLRLKGIELDGKTVSPKPGTSVANTVATMDSLRFDSGDGRPLAVDTLTIALDSTQTGNLLDGALRYGFGHIAVGRSDLGSLVAGGKVRHLDMAALGALSAEYNRLAAAHHGRLEGLTPDQGAALESGLMAVLASNPTVSIDPFKWKTDKGESTLMLAVNLGSPGDPSALANAWMLLPQVLKEITLKLSLSRPMLAQLVSQAQAADGQPGQDGFADMVVDQYMRRLLLTGMAQQHGQDLTTDIHYQGGKVDLNGQKMSVMEFAQRAAAAVLR